MKWVYRCDKLSCYINFFHRHIDWNISSIRDIFLHFPFPIVNLSLTCIRFGTLVDEAAS